MQRHHLMFTLLLLLAPVFAVAQDKHADETPMPEWDQLSSAQREELIAPLRERWNSSPDDRSRLYERARRWKSMPSDTRQRARHGMQRWEKMSPDQRQHAQALFHAMRGMDKEQRKAFLAQWQAMTPAQRQAWVTEHSRNKGD